jgi:hypothetical protein
MAMLFVEQLQRYRTVGPDGVVSPVHGRVPAAADGGLDDVAREPVTGRKHLLTLRFGGPQG